MKSMLNSVTSKDGTKLAFDRVGNGPPVVLVCGGSTDRMSNAGLAAILASDFTVFNFDRRGRGDSSDTLPYAVDREIEDIEAVIRAAGGTAFVYGTSSGAALVLDAAAAGVPATKVALWEPPYILDPSQRPPANTAETYNRFVAAGRRGDAVDYFMEKVVRLPAEFVEMARKAPWRASQEALAHTLAYDATIMGDYSLPAETAAKITVPTLVMTGTASMPFMRSGTESLVKALPKGELRVIEGVGHDAPADVLGPVLKDFFAG